MHSMSLVKLLLVVVLIFVTPFLDVREAARMRADPSAWRRLRFYRRTMVILWCLAAISCGVAGLHGIFAAPYTADASWTIGGRVGFGVYASISQAEFPTAGIGGGAAMVGRGEPECRDL
jgi:quinol-cytochrome oxidoreductase complex cytochrome b subunit